jgi:hypothetical protein
LYRFTQPQEVDSAMQEEIPVPVLYTSYLLRLWREERAEAVAWHSQVDHIQSGRRWSFDTLEQLLDFLRGQTEHQAARDPPGE